jgi:hypothetical protein
MKQKEIALTGAAAAAIAIASKLLLSSLKSSSSSRGKLPHPPFSLCLSDSPLGVRFSLSLCV